MLFRSESNEKPQEAEYGRTDDPVRMYLREMGSVELLSREGEIAIAKRIEAGREKMIGGICESPLTLKRLTEWRDALLEGKMLLRDVIDLEATMGAEEAIKASDAEDKGEADPDADAKAKLNGVKKPDVKAAKPVVPPAKPAPKPVPPKPLMAKKPDVVAAAPAAPNGAEIGRAHV